MGGMIAQLTAINHRERVRSLVSIMSTTGNRRVGQAAPRMLPLLLRRPQAGREAYVSDLVRTLSTIGSRRYPVESSASGRWASAATSAAMTAPAAPAS